MTDTRSKSSASIVERLRGIAVPITHEAAAEIERLQVEIEQLQDIAEAHIHDCNRETAAENERLTAALRDIIEISTCNSEAILLAIRKCAKRALGKK
jgi:hypothetical protein